MMRDSSAKEKWDKLEELLFVPGELLRHLQAVVQDSYERLRINSSFTHRQSC
jgi:hypothetical protein